MSIAYIYPKNVAHILKLLGVLEKVGVWTPFHDKTYVSSRKKKSPINLIFFHVHPKPWSNKKNAWGWRFCVGIDRKEHGPKKTCYDIFRTITLTLATVHVIAEVILITFHIDKVELDELTVSIAYGIQHFLGLVKVYIM